MNGISADMMRRPLAMSFSTATPPGTVPYAPPGSCRARILSRARPGEKLQGLVVYAAQQRDMWVIPGQHMHLIDVPGGFLDGGEIRAASHPVEEFLTHGRAGPARVVLQQDRRIDGAVNRQCMIGQL